MRRPPTALLALVLPPAFLWQSAPQGNLEVTHVRYGVDNLQIRGLVCAPRTFRPGRPLLMLEHGGFSSEPSLELCRRFAEQGYVVAQSAYRGQGGSQGQVEACMGEVRDSRALQRLVQDRYLTSKVGFLGVSLGGCVALKAAAGQSGVGAVVTLISPTDFAEQVGILQRTRPDAVNRWHQIFGGSPQDNPQAYAQRSPLAAAARVKAPLMVVAADQDPLIPVSQSCRVRDVRRKAGFRVLEVRLNRQGEPYRGELKAWRRCAGERPLGQLPPLRGEDVLLHYGDLFHTSTPQMWNAAEQFLAAYLQPRR
ncbi:dipeptidyl aminopeptidase/acylaminoacyl peptidase [Deinobacterium chartae]|uniref:Dipeptidyl aminopeptidase/acylaminoacyl peptidase n=1 Tax=Deinobacterium chartae TaxID=521158 RepID=A0A841I3W1_9DEIO|nr:CocE/NonD family hydrolase [Deinobacterium chartae]MBB6099068.1 dipeptidyl aminopeptidase/acylaminoacyl peptidase [Deinobacterium chartae]